MQPRTLSGPRSRRPRPLHHIQRPEDTGRPAAGPAQEAGRRLRLQHRAPQVLQGKGHAPRGAGHKLDGHIRGEMKKKIIAFVIAAAVAAGVAFYALSGRETPEDEPIKTAKVTKGSLRLEAMANGIGTPDVEVIVKSKAGGG